MNSDQPLPPVRGKMRNTFIGPDRSGTSGGLVIDGAVYALEGEPPVAASHGWGDLAWLRWRRLTGVRVVGR